MSESNANVSPTAGLDAAIEAAFGLLTRLAECLDAEPEVADRAAAVFLKYARRAIGPLAAALRLSRSPWHRVLIIHLLLLLRLQNHVSVRRVVRRVLNTDADPRVRIFASMALTELRSWEFEEYWSAVPGIAEGGAEAGSA